MSSAIKRALAAALLCVGFWSAGAFADESARGCVPSASACAPGSFCDFPAGECSDAAGGTCRPAPQACAMIYLPVCGCDGRTYGNDCARQAAGVSKRRDGEC